MPKWNIVYDWCPSWEPGQGWEDHDYYGEYDLEEEFEGSWDELQEHLHEMKQHGCYHIRVNEIYEYLLDD